MEVNPTRAFRNLKLCQLISVYSLLQMSNLNAYYNRGFSSNVACIIKKLGILSLDYVNMPEI